MEQGDYVSRVSRSQKSLYVVYAGVAELADALDLGSSVSHVGVQVPSPAPKNPSIFVDGFFIQADRLGM